MGSLNLAGELCGEIMSFGVRDLETRFPTTSIEQRKHAEGDVKIRKRISGLKVRGELLSWARTL